MTDWGFSETALKGLIDKVSTNPADKKSWGKLYETIHNQREKKVDYIVQVHGLSPFGKGLEEKDDSIQIYALKILIDVTKIEKYKNIYDDPKYDSLVKKILSLGQVGNPKKVREKAIKLNAIIEGAIGMIQKEGVLDKVVAELKGTRKEQLQALKTMRKYTNSLVSWSQAILNHEELVSILKALLLGKDDKIQICVCKVLLKMAKIHVSIQQQLILFGSDDAPNFLKEVIVLLSSEEKSVRSIAKNVLIEFGRDNPIAPASLKMLTHKHKVLRKQATHTLKDTPILYRVVVPKDFEGLTGEGDFIANYLKEHFSSTTSTSSSFSISESENEDEMIHLTTTTEKKKKRTSTKSGSHDNRQIIEKDTSPSKKDQPLSSSSQPQQPESTPSAPTSSKQKKSDKKKNSASFKQTEEGKIKEDNSSTSIPNKETQDTNPKKPEISSSPSLQKLQDAQPLMESKKKDPATKPKKDRSRTKKDKGHEKGSKSKDSKPKTKDKDDHHNKRKSLRHPKESIKQSTHHKHKTHQDKEIKTHHDFDEMKFVTALFLERVEPIEILYLNDEKFLAYLPFIVGYVRRQTEALNKNPASLRSQFYLKHWVQLVEIVLYKIHSNPNIGQRMSWLENVGHGFQKTDVKKSTSNPKTALFRIELAYLSLAHRNTEKMFLYFGQNLSRLENGYTFDNLNILVPTKLYGSATVQTIVCEKVFTSKARPIKMKWIFHPKWNLDPIHLIFKKGGDLTKDVYAESFFNIFNTLWANSPIKKKHRPYLEMYSVVPVVPKTMKEGGLSVIDFVPNTSVEKYDWNNLKLMTPEKRRQFLCSIAGAFLMGHTLSLRDRHKDNMLVRENNSCYLMIDFEFIFCDNPKYAPCLAIAGEFQNILIELNEWNDFLAIMGDGYLVLRRAFSLIAYFATELFQNLVSPNVPRLIATQLMMDQSESAAQSMFVKAVSRASAAFILALKNWGHTYAMTHNNPPQNSSQSNPGIRDEIKTELKTKIFTPFFTGDDPKTERSNGSEKNVRKLKLLPVDENTKPEKVDGPSKGKKKADRPKSTPNLKRHSGNIDSKS